jgi:hypothetical protein
MKIFTLAPSLLAMSLLVTSLAPAITQAGDLGFTDTSMLPGGKWHVHDPARPHPAIVTPGKTASEAPSDAIVLFDGSTLDAFKMSDGKPADWTLADGAMTVPKREGQHGDGSLTTKDSFGDIQLHLEFRSPAVVTGTSQNRGNSGVILMGQYEVQVLDSYENVTYADGQASAIYAWKPPLVNASRKPGEWQTYDIIFERPHFDAAGKVTKPAFVTVLHNGVLTQNHQEVLGKTDWKTLATYHPHADALPFTLQDHGTPVSYRNIWVRKLAPAEE